MTRRRLVAALSFWCVFLSASALSAPDSTTDGRHRHASSRGVVLFGGESSIVLSDTWVWNGEEWKQKFPATSPPARFVSAMAYDKARDEVVLFGGAGSDGYGLADTWVWNGEDWKQKFPAHSPPGLSEHGMAYDAAHREVVLFGGFGSSSGEFETWVWNGEDWQQKFPANSPGSERGVEGRAAYDEATKRVVLFGGVIPFAHFAASDTWEWDGSNWENKSSSVGPDGLFGRFTEAYDAARRKIVVFGVSEVNGVSGPVTWLWDGSTWEQVMPHNSPPERGDAMAYDAGHRKVVFFDGDNTSVWNGSDWRVLLLSNSPSSRMDYAMASNPARSHCRHGDHDEPDSEPDEE